MESAEFPTNKKVNMSVLYVCTGFLPFCTCCAAWFGCTPVVFDKEQHTMHLLACPRSHLLVVRLNFLSHSMILYSTCRSVQFPISKFSSSHVHYSGTRALLTLGWHTCRWKEPGSGKVRQCETDVWTFVYIYYVCLHL